MNDADSGSQKHKAVEDGHSGPAISQLPKGTELQGRYPDVIVIETTAIIVASCSLSD